MRDGRKWPGIGIGLIWIRWVRRGFGETGGKGGKGADKEGGEGRIETTVYTTHGNEIQ